MNKYKIKISDNKYYVVYSESRENAVKKLRDAYINKNFKITDYQPKEISHSRLEAIPLQARQELQNSKNKWATLLSIEGNIEDIINAAEPSNREELKQIGSKITNDLIRQFRITDNVDRNKIEQVIKSRQFELRRDGDKIQEYIYKGNSEDKKNAFEELAKVLPANVGLGLSGDVLSVSFRDNTIKDDNISEFKKELAKWQDLYINKKLITSSELSEKAKELRQKYNIKDEKLTSESILEKAKSLGGQAKQNGATGVLGISISSPQRSDEFADWLEKNNIHYNSDGRQYYVEIQDCEIEDKLIQSGSEEAFKKNIATEIRDGTCKVSSNDFGVATMFGPKSKEDLERLARANEKVYLEYEVNGRNRGFWKAASSLLKQLNSGTMRIIKVYDSAISDAEIPHITKEQWNKIPNDYKLVDPVTGKKMAFAGSLGIAPGGTTLLTEGKHFIIDTGIEDSLYNIKDKAIEPNDIKVGASFYSITRFNNGKNHLLTITITSVTDDLVETIEKSYWSEPNSDVYKKENTFFNEYKKQHDKSAQNVAINAFNANMTRWVFGKPNVKINDSSIKDSISKVENIGKFTLWQDEDTKEYYFDATISRSGKKLHPLGTKDINKAREKVKKELEWITDSSIEDSYYTESEKKNKQFVKNAIEEMEGYINNWNFLTAKQKRDIGASREQLKARVAELKQVKDSSIKDAYDYIGNAMVFKSLPRIGEKAQKYGFGYSNSVISKIEKIYNKDGYQFYRVYCMDEEDYKNNHGTQYYYSVAIKDSNIVRDYSIEDAGYAGAEKLNGFVDSDVKDSIMQEYEEFKSRLGKEKAKSLDKFLNTHNNISYSDILYKKAEYDKFENWYSKGMKDNAINDNKYKRDCNTVVNDSEPKNWTYVMFGTTGEKKVENLTKAEAEHLLKNNKLLGYSGKIYETVKDNDTNNTNKILDSDIVVARSLDELISKIESWDGETTTNYILSPKSSGWYFDYFITMGHKYSYYAYIKKTAYGRHDNPNVDISKQNIDKTVTAKTAQELIDQVVRILK